MKKQDRGPAALKPGGVICEVCGRPPAWPGAPLTTHCWRVVGYFQRENAAECYRLGYEQMRGHLALLQKQLFEERAETWRLRGDVERRAANICACGHPRTAHTGARGCVELFLHGEEASSASDPKGPPDPSSSSAAHPEGK